MLDGIRAVNKGRRPPNYIDGSSKNRKYTDPIWKEIAKKIYFRDNYECIICDKKGGRLNAHHIIDRSIKEFRHDLLNGISLCPNCHKWNRIRSPHRSSGLYFIVWLLSEKPIQAMYLIHKLKDISRIGGENNGSEQKSGGRI
jgi:hypothetical protein